MCALDEVEDETDFPTRCTAYEDRRQLFESIKKTQQMASDTYLCVANAEDRKKEVETIGKL